jgi:trimethylamine--corrinoid protein Co-methyltransferase
MTTQVRVLTDEQRAAVHERSLAILERTGVRVDSGKARAILAEAGARVDDATRIVRFPPELVERSIALAPKRFSLGGRRPGFALPMNEGGCALVADGEGVHVLDAATGERRSGSHDDWVQATRLLDAADEVGVYWRMIEAGLDDGSPAAAVHHWTETFGLFSKHVQDGAADAAEAAWLLEVLDVVFGGREAVRRDHPFSFLVCPVSPLVLEGPHTDGYLATVGWDIPIAVMPMPIMGLTAPVGLLSTIALGNCEVLAMLCLVQAAVPGTPFIYAPALAAMEPRSGRWSGGAIEHGLLGAATTEVARGYGLPVESSTGGSDQHIPGIQAAYERGTTWTLPALSWPDLLVGPGLLGGSTILSLEQLVIDLEVFRRCERLHRGIEDVATEAVEAAVAEAGPGGDFLARPATRDAVHGGEWYIDRLGDRRSFERWDEAGRPDLLAEARAVVETTIAGHEPMPLDPAVTRELARIERAALEGAAGEGATSDSDATATAGVG